MKKHKSQGFTLIELMVAVIIFAIISIISYKTLSSLVTTKEVVETAQNKWGGVSKTINQMSTACHRAIPLVIRDENGLIMPAVLGKNKLNSKYDAQLELTTSGFIGDPEYGSIPPKRVGFRFVKGKLYLVAWPVLNRVQSTVPDLKLLLEHIAVFNVNFLYPDKQWRDTWPLDSSNIGTLPTALKVYIKMDSGEEITRQWIL